MERHAGRLKDESRSRLFRRHRIRAFSVAVVFLLTASAGAYAQAIGRVLDLEGDWRLYRHGADDSRAEPLSQWQAVPPGGVIRALSPVAEDFITIVDARGKTVLAERRCRNVMDCNRPLFLPQSDGADIEQASLLAPVWNLLRGEPYLVSMHRTRGAGLIMAEGVAELAGGKIDIADLMRNAPAGAYTLAPYAAGGDRTSFEWDPDAAVPVHVEGERPGLYRISLDELAEGELPSAGVSIAAFVCGPARCSKAVAALVTARGLAANWGDAAGDETRHQFVRAYLAAHATGEP
jgi:hypothetical protein